ncbi:Hypothetical predicted protein, partial [Mytilus galloprovincialis]
SLHFKYLTVKVYLRTSFSPITWSKMRGIGVFYNKVKQLLLTNRDKVDRYIDHMTLMAVAGVCYPIYTIGRMHMKTKEDSPLTKQKYALIGDKTITDKVEQEIRRKLGHPVKPFYLMKWRYTEIEKIESEEQFKKLQNDNKPITLYLCTSSTTDLTSKNVFLPSSTKDLPKSITKLNIIVVERAEDDLETVNKCVTSLDARSDIKALFNNTSVLLFTPDANRDMNIQY